MAKQPAKKTTTTKKTTTPKSTAKKKTTTTKAGELVFALYRAGKFWFTFDLDGKSIQVVVPATDYTANELGTAAQEYADE